jgi:4-diphosphocytidyl-2-C-methyl-D-erythritol kinase
VQEAFDWLDARAEARLTGTGACLFAAFDQRREAEHVLQQVPPRMPAFVARGCNRSPLFAPPPAAGDAAEEPACG